MQFYTKRQLAAKLGGCHDTTIMRLVARGALPKPIKLTPNSRCLFEKEATDRRLAALQAGAAGGDGSKDLAA